MEGLRLCGWEKVFGLSNRNKLWRSVVLSTIDLRLWGVAKVCLVLLLLSLNLFLLFQNLFLLLQEREVNENAVDEDLIYEYEIKRY